MSALGDGLAAVFGRGLPTGFGDQLGAVIGHHGSVTAAARALGLARSTLQRWRAGTTAPKADSRERISAAARDATAPRIDTTGLQFHTVGNDGRHRVLSAANQVRLSKEAAQDARLIWVTTGEQEDSAKALWRGIGDPIYKDYLAPEDASEFEMLDSDYCAASVTLRP